MEQYIIVGIIVSGCVVYLLRRFVFKPKSAKNTACGGCDKCGGGGCH